MCSSCGPAPEYTVTDAAGRSWRFEMHHFIGPTVLGARSEPLSRQPGSRSPFWPAFEAWQASDKTAKAIRKVLKKEGS